MSIASLVAALNDALPQTQCTRCGYADCRAYADAIANDGARSTSVRRVVPKASNASPR
jgi:Na+-translocating ferredoxin:NAD+ oxidoreductase RNF subunit RnfB